MIQALDIVTNRLTVTNGAKIGDYSIEQGGIDAVFTDWNSTPKFKLSNNTAYNNSTKYFSMGMSNSLFAKNTRTTFPGGNYIDKPPGSGLRICP